QEPDCRDWSEDRRNFGRTKALHRKNPDNKHKCDGNDEARKAWRHDLEALDGRKHRDCRSDDGVAKEQCSTSNAETSYPSWRSGEGFAGQGDEGQRTTLAIVVRTGDEENIFDGDGQRKRPDDE